MNESLSKMRKIEQLSFAEDIDFREFDRSKSRFTICHQEEMAFSICHAEKIKMGEFSFSQIKQRQAEIPKTKIGKNMLRQCFGSVVNCLSQLLQSLNVLSQQIVHLYTQTTHQIIFSVLHQKTIQPAINILKNLPKQSNDDLNNYFSQLLSASKEISKRICYFKKEFISKKPNYEIPMRSKIFSAYLQ